MSSDRTPYHRADPININKNEITSSQSNGSNDKNVSYKIVQNVIEQINTYELNWKLKSLLISTQKTETNLFQFVKVVRSCMLMHITVLCF